MTEAELRALIRATVEEILAPKRALVLFSGALLGFEAAIEQLRALAASGVELDYLQTPSAKRILNQELIESLGMQEVSTKLVAAHQLLIIPTLTVNVVGKVVHGIGDCLSSNLMAEFIMAGRPVVAVRNAACPDHPDKLGWFPQMPPGYAAMLRDNLTTLSGFGVRLPEAADLHDTVMAAFGRPVAAPSPASAAPGAWACGQRLISNTIVAGLADGTQLRIRPDATVTAMALDTARTRKISIVRVQED